mmetsp:Transcript_5160/g.6326  ORF Transcript_5160/g.6326 Transcript_5160/m.6326 type:complete len:88 (+) Transcript_5160:284-547(+)
MGKIDEERKKIDDLKRKALEFKNKTCAVCNNLLQTPAVLFMCGHTLCEQCSEDKAADNRRVCSVCWSANEILASKHREREQKKHNNI